MAFQIFKPSVPKWPEQQVLAQRLDNYDLSSPENSLGNAESRFARFRVRKQTTCRSENVRQRLSANPLVGEWALANRPLGSRQRELTVCLGGFAQSVVAGAARKLDGKPLSFQAGGLETHWQIFLSAGLPGEDYFLRLLINHHR